MARAKRWNGKGMLKVKEPPEVNPEMELLSNDFSDRAGAIAYLVDLMANASPEGGWVKRMKQYSNP